MTALPPGLRLPDYDGASLRAVLPAALDAIGAPTTSHGRDSAADRELLGLPLAPKVCVVLIDGLGAHQLAQRGGHAPFMRGLLPDSLTLTSGYPSTTASSLTMFGTGSLPGQTGMLGYSVRNPADGSLLNLVSWEGATVEPRRWQPLPTLVEQLGVEEWGSRVVSVGPGRFIGSGLTEAALRGPRFVPGHSLADRVTATCRLLREPRTDLVYLYWGDVDKIGHQQGWGSAAWGEAVELADAELARLATELPRGTLLVVTADHGMVDLEDDSRIDVAQTPALAQDVVLVAGEPRAVHVHTVPGRAAEVAARWREVLADTAWVLLREQAEEIGLFGPVAERHQATVGDIVVAARGTRAVVDSRTQTPASIGLIGVHGSLTPQELEIPLLRLVV